MTFKSKGSATSLAFERKSIQIAGGFFRPHAVAICATGNHSKVLPLHQNEPIENIAKRFRAIGWEFDAYNSRRIRCPECIAADVIKRKGESPKGDSNVTTIPTKLAIAAAAPDKTALTIAEREKVRGLLEGVFDADKGFYLDNYSDARIGSELDLPEKLVREYRDIAFGPLKSSPDLEAIRADLKKLEDDAVLCLKAAKQLGDRATELRANVVKAELRLADQLKRMGLE